MGSVTELFSAIERGEPETVRRLVAADRTLVDAVNTDKRPAVLEATYRGRDDIAAILIADGARLDVFSASATGSHEQLGRLLDADASVLNAFSNDGWTPLHLAAFFGRHDAMRTLLRRGADVNARSRSGEMVTPLHSALANPSHASIAQVLLEAGADPNARQKQGLTPLHYAAYNGLEQLIRELLSRAADPMARDDAGKTPYDLAVERGHTTAAAALKSR